VFGQKFTLGLLWSSDNWRRISSPGPHYTLEKCRFGCHREVKLFRVGLRPDKISFLK
jgi:hypothetical protein